MIRGAIAAAAAWAWASAALAQPSGVDLAQSLNAVVFAPRSAPAAMPVIVVPESNPAFIPGTWKPFTFNAPTGSWGGARDALGASTTVTLWSADGIRQRLHAMGVKDGEDVFGGQGRIYVFAAVHGQAVGMNLQGLQRAGWSTDYSSALVGDGQIGVGWRKGGFEADFGYVHRSVHLENTPLGASDGYADDMAALSFTFHPHW